MGGIRKRIFGSALFFSAIYGFTVLDKAANFVQVDAYLEGVEETCHLEKVEGSAFSKHKTMTESAPCHIVEPLAASHPGYVGYNVVRTVFYKVSYKSDDGRWLMGKLTNLTSHDGHELEIGDKTPILMHKTDNAKIRKI